MTAPAPANFVDQSEFDQLIAENEILVAYHTLPFCGLCKLVTPLVEKLASNYGDKPNGRNALHVSVVKVDVIPESKERKAIRHRKYPRRFIFPRWGMGRF